MRRWNCSLERIMGHIAQATTGIRDTVVGIGGVASSVLVH